MLKFGMREQHANKCLDEWPQIGVIGIGEVVIHAGPPHDDGHDKSGSLAITTQIDCDAGYTSGPRNSTRLCSPREEWWAECKGAFQCAKSFCSAPPLLC